VGDPGRGRRAEARLILVSVTEPATSVRSSRGLALAAAFLSGAAGLGLQSLLLSAGGLALGYGGSVAIGLTVWLVAWAIGAGLARRRGFDRASALAWVGGALCVLSPAAVWSVLFAGRALAGGPAAVVVAIVALAVPAVLQGLFLPLLAQRFERVGWLFAFNLLGSVVGAFAISDRAVGEFGRLPAAWLAGMCACAAGSIGAIATSGARRVARAEEDSPPQITRARAFVVVACATAWMAALEWVSYRLGVLWLGGMQNALNAVLCASLIGLALGALLLSPLFERRRHALVALLLLCVACSVWPFFAASALERMSGTPLFVRALVLCAPVLFGFGAVIPIVQAARGRAHDARGELSRLLAAEALGALIGIPLVHFVVVPHHGLSGAIAVAIGFGAVALMVVSRSAWIPAALVALFAAFRTTPARDSLPYSNPALTVLSLAEDLDFAVGVVDDGMLGERTLLTDGFRAAGTGRDYLYMQALGHLPVLLHPSPKRVAVLALGTGTTVGAVSLHERVERIDVLEISRAVVDAAPYFVEKNHGALAEGWPGLVDDSDGVARVVVKLGDGRATLARSPSTYDVITMEPLLPDSPFAIYLYTAEFYEIAKRALNTGGIVCQWVPPHALEPATFEATCSAFARAFAWNGVWVFGTQVVLVGGHVEPTLDAARFEGGSEGLRTALAGLGLSTENEVLARWCGRWSGAANAERALTDIDPWTVFLARRRGAVLLLDLPLNLGSLPERTAHDSSPFEIATNDAATGRAADGQRELRAARVAHAYREAELRGARSEHSTSARFEAHLVLARTLLVGDPDLARFEAEVNFLADIRSGVSALSSSSARMAAQTALEPLISAAESRSERADVHLYNAIALERLGSKAAAKALERALKACPKLAATPEAQNARKLFMSDALWQKLVDAERTARD